MNRTPLKTNPEKVRAWNMRSRKSLAVHSTLKSHKPMRKVGKVGKANIAANRRLKEILNAVTCEIGELGWPLFTECLGGMFLQNVHRHKRSWYKGDAERLSEYVQVVRGCTNCHEFLEHKAQLTETVFIKLRGKE